jgi:hypothetical protein
MSITSSTSTLITPNLGASQQQYAAVHTQQPQIAASVHLPGGGTNDLIARDPTSNAPLLSGPSRADISAFADAYSEAGLDDSGRLMAPSNMLLGLSEGSEGLGVPGDGGGGIHNKGLIGELYRQYHSRYDGSGSGKFCVLFLHSYHD